MGWVKFQSRHTGPCRPLLRCFLQQVAPFGFDDLTLLRAENITFRKLIAPGEWPASIDQHTTDSQVAGLPPSRRKPRIEIRGPGVANNIDRSRRVDSRTHRPQDLVEIGRIDVLIHSDIVSLHVALAEAGGRNERLLGMPGVTLAQSDDRDEPVKETPNSGDVGNAGALQMFPYLYENLNVAPAHGPKGRRAVDDGILSMIDALDAHDRFPPLMGVIARPFAEGSFVSALFGYRRNESFHHKVGAGGHGQTR